MPRLSGRRPAAVRRRATAAALALALARLPAAAALGAAAQMGAEALKPWIPRMKVRSAHRGKLEDLAREHRVVVVMTTIPKRIDRIEPVLDAMLAQTWPVEALYLSIPDKYNRTGEPYVIPEWLKSKPGVQIVRCEDLGPGTHLLNGMRLEKDPWTFLAVVDDDHIYSPDLVETLMRAALAHPGSAVAAQGFLSVPGLELTRDSPRYLHDQGFAAGPVLVSYLGVVYQRGFFDDTVFDYSGVATHCKYQDDMWFSAHLARKGIRRAVLGAALGVQELKEMHLGPESLTYWQENKPRHISIECDRTLKEHDANIWAFRRRVVLALGGLPPLLPASAASAGAPRCGAEAVVAALGGGALEGAEEWREAIAALKKLPQTPDLVYLCTETFEAGREEAGGEAGDETCGASSRGGLGATFRLEGLLVTPSGACRARDMEPRVGQLLRDPLQWEGDPHTVVVFGTLRDVIAQASNVEALAACAAERSGTDDAEEARGRAGREAPHEGGPFCRQGELAAVSVGAFEQLARG